MVEPIRSLRLPQAEEHEIVLIRLADGTVVARTRKELEAQQASQPKEGEHGPGPASSTGG
jgi:hypothetical protein